MSDLEKKAYPYSWIYILHSHIPLWDPDRSYYTLTYTTHKRTILQSVNNMQIIKMEETFKCQMCHSFTTGQFIIQLTASDVTLIHL